jgi:acetylornithine deacetylase/succinyl-diaminopimelate desuccinylase-like protein
VVLVSSGGSGPLHPFVHHLDVPVVMIGIGHAGGRVHAPNENIRWIDVERGTFATVRAIERWSGLTPSAEKENP